MTFIKTLGLCLCFTSVSNLLNTFKQNLDDFISCTDQAYVHKSVMEELKRIIDDSEITKEDDALWPPPDRVGRQVCVALAVGWSRAVVLSCG